MNHKLFKDRLIKLATGIWEVEGLPEGEYDAQALKYDSLISNALYNKIMWGNSPKDYTNFARECINKSEKGIIADIGCGTLSFTSKVYADISNEQDLILCDLSAEMLGIGKKRIEPHSESEGSLSFLRADALQMPFKENTIGTILSFGLLHIFDNPSNFLKECKRILMPGGQLHLTSLCTDRKISAKYLNLLQSKGHVATPRKSDEIGKTIDNAGFIIMERKVKGGMMYVSARK